MAIMKNFFFLTLWLSIIITGIFLGRWQLERLEWKRHLLAQIDHAYQTPPESDFSKAQDIADITGFARARLTLRFNPTTRWLIEPRVHHDVVGAYVYESAITSEGEGLWVNRGFVPKDKVGLIDNRSEATTLTLQIVKPSPSYGRMTDIKGNGYTFLWKNLGQPSLIGVVEYENKGETVYPLPIGTRPVLPNDHRHYAIFWFGMSVVAALFGVGLIIRKIYWTRAVGEPVPSEDA